MRHAIVSQYDPDLHVAGGINGFIRDLVRHAGAGHHFRIIGVTDRRRSVRKLGQWVDLALDGDATAEFMPVARIAPAAKGRWMPHTAHLARGIIRFRPQPESDIVHFHRAETAAICARLMSPPGYVLFLHGAAQANKRGAKESFWRFAPGAYALVERQAVDAASVTYIMDQRKTKLMQGQFPNVRPGENWYDSSIFWPREGGKRAGRPLIGWIGRFDESKDPLLAVHVFASLAERGLLFEAWMAGDGPLRPQVEDQLRAKRLDAVHLAGVLSARNLAHHLRATDACVVTSRWEGIPRAVIEALACGVPVVSTDVGDVPDLVTSHAGLIVKSATVHELTLAVESVLARANQDVASTVTHLDVRRVVPQLLGELEEQRNGTALHDVTIRPATSYARIPAVTRADRTDGL